MEEFVPDELRTIVRLTRGKSEVDPVESIESSNDS